MNEVIEKLLQPLSAEQPCGPDLSNDGQFDELETILKGKPEVEIGNIQKPAEPPDWKELKNRSTEFLGRSKHIRVATIFCCCQLKANGLAGFRDGVQLIQGLLEKYWAALYPLLDPDDNNDPTQRLNILGALTVPRGSSAAGWLTIVDSLYAAPVCQPKGGPPITFDNLIASRQPPTAPVEGAPPPTGPSAAAVASAMREAGNEQLLAQRDVIQQALEAVRAIDQYLTTTLGATNTISFEVAEKALQEMLGGLQGHLEGASVDGVVADATTEGAGGDASAGGITVRGSIRSREDVVRVIDSICNYYEQVEPCSPVPYLLRRAQKLAGMNFIEAVQELNLATVDSLRPSMGSAVPSDAPPAA
ncbi:MAG TPA: type VI secretion system protein TssA [Verrucomicrobiae bacterium]|jgi:type VI secretion system protein ImpA|nr:type VI secretion system protein TssA [Verrucomicrobiae bacterium]